MGRKGTQNRASSVGKPTDFDAHPSFCFSYNTIDRYTLADALGKDKTLAKALLKRFQQWEAMTKGSILQAPRTGLGTETIPQKSIKPALPESLPRNTTLLAVRISDRARLVGFWDKARMAVFQIVYIDPDHSVY